MQLRGTYGILGRQLGVQRRPAFGAGLGGNPCAQRRVGRGQIGEPGEKRAEVEHRAAGQHRHPATGAHGLHAGGGILRELRRRVGLGRVADIDQVMPNPRLILRAGLGGADVHAAIDLRRIDADQLPAQPLAEREREAGLPRSRGAEHDDSRNLPHRRATARA